jgi:UPF0755 protein
VNKAKARRTGGGLVGGLSWLVSLAIFGVGALLLAAIMAIVLIGAPGPSQEARTIVIERGASASSITRQLQGEKLIENDLLFRAAALLYAGDGGLKAGEYEIPAGASIKQIVDLLASGRAKQYSITIPEGYSVAQVMDLLEAAPNLTGPLPETPPEGTLLPDTYSFARGASRSDIMQKMAAAHAAVMAEIWPKRVAGLPFDTPAQAVTLASIVEKETGKPEERRVVAGLYINRLRRGMRLEADPTIIYGVTKGRPLGRQIRRSEIDAGPPQNPWNTYRISGLPPSPIANPGRLSLEAVLNPEPTEYLFMVADGTGGHLFARTGDEHARNHAAWREIRARKVAEEKAAAAARSAGAP